MLAAGAAAQEESARVYTWQDGDRTQQVILQTDLVLLRDATEAIVPEEALVASTGAGVIVRTTDEEEDEAPGARVVAAAVSSADALPVFRSRGGALMALPGGVIVLFDETSNEARANAFFAAEGIRSERVSPLALDNSWLVETEPGFPSLELANRLANHPGVDVASPNWWRQAVTK